MTVRQRMGPRQTLRISVFVITSSDLKLTAVSTDIKRVSADALVVGLAAAADSAKEAPRLVASPLPKAETAELERALRLAGATGKADEIVRLPAGDGTKADVVISVGLGKVTDASVDIETLRRAAGSVARQVTGLEKILFALPAADLASAAAVAEGIALGAYRFESLRSSKSEESVLSEGIVATDAAVEAELPAAFKRAAVVGRAVRAVRDLVNTSSNLLYPETFAQVAYDGGKAHRLKVTVLDEKRLEKDGYGGIMGVGRGSDRPPRLVKVEYAPSKPKKHLAIVGKGITFDTGGISIKPAANMHHMKSDMAGAATALQTVLAVAELGLPVKVTAWLCLAENMPSGSATRPGDVVTMFNGKTVEILNTDAEGRLVMGDGLAAASLEKPDVVLDIATLTGAQMVALGRRTTGLMGDDEVRDALKAAADAAGETAWPMPLPEELRPSIASEVADLANIGERFGGMMTAAVFLQEFVGEVDGHRIPWAHIDIAGPSFNDSGAFGYTPKNGTGTMVRTLVAYTESLAV
ncbi:leucyl aminopeptidase [Zhihengliuella halotolerans]|uniref:Probable cytosol aminopeptidase n=1 Tax=Zhihengliuella halotolerans TaxID=370736 RepID=A0A4Q8AAJ2_9MICC|nr:leucyl aminopeptidase [Zhihengliuella halotolerans]